MALFLQTSNLHDRDPLELLAARRRNANDLRYLKHWLDSSGGKIGILIEAPDAETILSAHPDAIELTELHAPVERWLTCDDLDFD
jgi:hypothetical protein